MLVTKADAGALGRPTSLPTALMQRDWLPQSVQATLRAKRLFLKALWLIGLTGLRETLRFRLLATVELSEVTPGPDLADRRLQLSLVWLSA